jgi:subtilisin family serine protease
VTARAGSLAALALVVAATAVSSQEAPRAVGAAAFQVPSGVYRVLHRRASHRPATHRRVSSARSISRIVVAPIKRVGARPPAAAPTTVIPTDPGWSQEWGLSQIGAPAAWHVSTGSKPVVVAVVDSGVDPSQPDLQGALVQGADFADGTGSTADQYGHGTMVAGVIAARPDNGVGGAGICWTCVVMPVKVLGADGTGTAAAIAGGIRYAADHGASVISMSFVLSGPDAGVESALAYAHSRGVLLVAAAGNTGSDSPTYPASYPDVVSVAAVDPTGALYPWSARGPWVTLAAPGCAYTTVLGGGFTPSFCGTSAAAPLVAGLAGLALSAGNGSTAGVESALEQTAVPLPGVVGSGRVDAAALLDRQSAS